MNWEQDARSLIGFARSGKDGMPNLDEGFGATLQRVREVWPSSPSDGLRLACLAHQVDNVLDDRFSSALGRLTYLLEGELQPIAEEDRGMLVLAALILLEQVDYRDWTSARGSPMVLRDALAENAEDLATIAARVRFDALIRLAVFTPDDSLGAWRRRVQRIEGGYESLDASEYFDALNTRRRLQGYVSDISWAGQVKWQAHIEPVDARFRACTERQAVDLALTVEGRPGAWWDYRLPRGEAPSVRWDVGRVSPDLYIAEPGGGGIHTLGRLSELALRPGGLEVLTAHELDRWTTLCARQAEREAARGARSQSWTRRLHEVRAEHERRSRQ